MTICGPFAVIHVLMSCPYVHASEAMRASVNFYRV